MSSLVLLIGKQGTGKSTTFCKLAESLPDRSLILDPGYAKAYENHGFVRPDQLHTFRGATGGKIKRVLEPIEKAKVIAQIYGYNLETKQIDRRHAFLNGNLFMEDAGSYLDSNLNRSLRACVKSFKQYGQNLFLSYHAIDEVSTEILKLSPHAIILKKSGDLNVFSKITKARKLGNYQNVMQAFYRVKFKGLGWKDIKDELPADEFIDIGKDIGLTAKGDALAKALAKFANGKITMSEKEKLAGKYYEETVMLRL